MKEFVNELKNTFISLQLTYVHMGIIRDMINVAERKMDKIDEIHLLLNKINVKIRKAFRKPVPVEININIIEAAFLYDALYAFQIGYKMTLEIMEDKEDEKIKPIAEFELCADLSNVLENHIVKATKLIEEYNKLPLVERKEYVLSLPN